MKKLLIALSIVVISLMAVDYSQMTMEELNALRGTIEVEEREAFRAEMQSRVAVMTPEEQAAFRAERQANKGSGLQDGSRAGAALSQGQGTGQRLQDGSGAGRMSQGTNSGQGGQGNRGGNK